jgi:hypothetical protein
MTLNITILTPLVIYQSADFRLTDSGTGKPLRDPSPKTVSLSYLEWSGFVTYTGIGSWRNRNMSDYLVGWLTGVSAPDIAEVASIITDNGTRLLQEVERRSSRFKHTFTLVGFVDQIPQVYVISNFEDCFGNSRNDVDERLTVSNRSLSYGEKATVIVTGYKAVIPRTDRRMLGTVAAKYPGDGLRIRRRMASLNAEASTRSRGMVSKECVVLSLRSDGNGATLLSGDADQTPRQLPQVMSGIDAEKLFKDSLKKMGVDPSQVRVDQMASASIRPGQRTVAHGAACNYAVVNPEPSSSYEATEIKAPDFAIIGAADINDRGQIVGTGRAGFGTDQPQNLPWSFLNGQARRLNYYGLAAAINNEGNVTAVQQGADAPPPSWQRAAVYIDGNLIELPLYHGQDESPERSDSQISAINSSSLMAGSVAVQRDKHDSLAIHAAVFRIGHPIQIFSGLQTDTGCRAFGVNDQDHVLLIAEVRPFDVRSILWNPADDSWHYVGDDTTNVFPIALNDDDVVLGQARNARNEPVAVVCQPGGKWERLGTPDSWAPVDINNKCEVIGRVMIDLLERPWVHRLGGRTEMLPYLTNHHTGAGAINNLGQIVGGAWADNDSHALLWTAH